MPGESLPTLDNGQVDGGTVLDISDPVPVVAPEEPCEQLPCSHDTPAPAADGVPEPTDTNVSQLVYEAESVIVTYVFRSSICNPVHVLQSKNQ